MKKLLTAMVLVVLAFLFSCESMIDSNNQDNNTPAENFNFNTTRGIEVAIKTLDDQGQPVSRVKFDVIMNDNVISSGMTKSNGQFKTYVHCPTSISELEIFTNNSFYYGKQKLEVIDNQAYFTFDGYVQTEEGNSPMGKLTKATSDDDDGDGVLNGNDDYPDDPDKAWDNKVSGTLIFEDLWPKLGDYDFNDFVVEYEFNRITKYDPSNDHYDPVTYLEGTFVVIAAGATFDNGFGFELPLLPKIDATLIATESTLPNSAPKSLEIGQTSPVVILSNSISDDFFDGNKKVNTQTNKSYQSPTLDTIKVMLEINSDAYWTLSTLGTPPYNPFLTRVYNPSNSEDKDGNERIEIHMINCKPTDFGTTDLWGTKDDDSDELGNYYRDLYGMPWAINLPVKSFKYPQEKADIRDAYPEFRDWFHTNGETSENWYNEQPNSGYIYSAP